MKSKLPGVMKKFMENRDMRFPLFNKVGGDKEEVLLIINIDRRYLVMITVLSLIDEMSRRPHHHFGIQCNNQEKKIMEYHF